MPFSLSTFILNADSSKVSLLNKKSDFYACPYRETTLGMYRDYLVNWLNILVVGIHHRVPDSHNLREFLFLHVPKMCWYDWFRGSPLDSFNLKTSSNDIAHALKKYSVASSV